MSLVYASEEVDLNSIVIHASQRANWGIDSALEAFILYDEIFVDGPSFRRNNKRFEKLNGFAPFCREIPLTANDEEAIYEIALRNCVGHLREATADFDTHHSGISYPMLSEFYAWGDLSAGWLGIEASLSEAARSIARQIRTQATSQLNLREGHLVSFVRAFYYDVLQQRIGIDLILHPCKGSFIRGNQRAGINILNIFDDTVRRQFEERRGKWIHKNELMVPMPMLTRYVLKQCNSWQDLPQAVYDVRVSDEAKNFRKGLQRFMSAAETGDNVECDKVIAELEEACNDWGANLGEIGLKRNVRVSIPLFNVSADLEIPDLHLTKTAGRQILVFVHELLSKE